MGHLCCLIFNSPRDQVGCLLEANLPSLQHHDPNAGGVSDLHSLALNTLWCHGMDSKHPGF